MGLGSAVISSIEGQDLCEVCVVIRDESRKQGEAGNAKDASSIAKTLLLPFEAEESFPRAPRGSFAGLVESGAAVPQGRIDDVVTAPPRFEV